MMSDMPAPLDPQARFAADQAAFDALSPGFEQLTIWQPRLTLAVTTAEARLPRFGSAAQRARSRGIPVIERRSGGGAVCLGPGTLVVSHLYTSMRNDLMADYRDFGAKLTDAFTEVGVALATAEVANAYCNGLFDLSWRGRKVGGMAQRRATQRGVNRIWIEAVFSIDAESRRYPEEVARFYADLQTSRVAHPCAATVLADCFPTHVSASGLLGRSQAAIARRFGSARSAVRQEALLRPTSA